MRRPEISASLTLTVTHADPEKIAPLLEQMAALVRASGGAVEMPGNVTSLPESVRKALGHEGQPRAVLPALGGVVRRRERYRAILQETVDTFALVGRHVQATALQLGVSQQCVYRRLTEARKLGLRSNRDGLEREGAA